MPMTNFWVDELFKRLQKLNPKPETELLYTNPYTLLVAVVLSAQATDKGVNKATAELFKIADTPEKMVNLGEERLLDYLKTLNLYKTKTRNVIGLSRILLERYKGQIPEDREALESLPGVGRKTANVVLNVAFGKETIAVDTHIFRVANRTGLGTGKTPLDVEKILERIIPKEFRLHAHHWLILHGRYICTAKNPKCEVCPISDLCQYFKSKI
jgi:endonuclease-3